MKILLSLLMILFGTVAFAETVPADLGNLAPPRSTLQNGYNSFPTVAPLLGGQFLSFAQLEKLPVAFIQTDTYQCTGVLVGTREILTAGHCIGGAWYLVVVGGALYDGLNSYYNGNYQLGGSTDISNSMHDLGIIQLSQPVTNVLPIPVLYDLPPEVGSSSFVFGFGSNELSFSSDFSGIQGAKSGKISITAINNGMFSSRFLDSGVAICHGDSGGPVIAQIGDYYAVTGINSTGYAQDVYGACLAGGGISNYVDVQSGTSKNFISYFSGVQRLSGALVVVEYGSRLLVDRIAKLSKLNNLRTIQSKAKSFLKAIALISPLCDAKRKQILGKTKKALVQIAQDRTLPKAKSRLKSAYTSAKQLYLLGHY